LEDRRLLATTLVSNTTVADTVGALGENDSYEFTAAVGDRIVLSAGEGTTAANFEPFLRLFAPGGAVVDTDNGTNSAYIEVTAAAAGTYTVLLGEAQNTSTGEYRLYFLKVPFAGTATDPADGEGKALASHSTTNAAIGAVGDVDLYTMTAAAGERLVFSAGEGTTALNFEPYLRLYAPDGTAVATSSSATTAYVEVTAATAGAYTLIVREADNATTGQYRLHFAKAPHTGAATDPADGEGRVLTSHTTAAASIATVGDVDVYTVAVAAGERLIFSAGEGTTAANFEPHLSLYAPGGAVVDTASGSNSAYVEVVAAAAGTYTLLVREAENTSTGEYRLRFVRAPGGAQGTDPADGEGQALASNTTTAAAVGDVGDLDVYTFAAAAGDRLVFSAGEGTTALNFEPYLRLFAPDGAVVATSSSATTAYVEATAAAAGTYTLVVREADNATTGEYRLHFAKLPHAGGATDPADGEGKALASHTTTTASIATLGDFDLYAVTAAVGDRLILSAGEGATAANFEPYLRLYGPTGALVAESSSSNAAYIEYAALAAGTYNLLVREAENTSTGEYRLHAARLPQAPIVADPADGEGGAVASHTSTAAAIATVGDVDLYSISAAVGDRLILSVGEGVTALNFEPYLRLYAPDGTVVATSSASGSGFIETTATAAGTYTVLVREADDTTTGEYRLHAVRLPQAVVGPDPADGDGKPLVSNTTTAAAIATVGDVDVYSFAVAFGQRVVLSVGEGVTVPNFEPYLALYGPNGSLVDASSASNSGYLEFTAAVAGTYNVVVREAENTTTGQYRLYFARLPLGGTPTDPFDGEGKALATGTTTHAAVAAVGDVDLYTFTAAVGESVTLTVGDLTGNAFGPRLVVYRPDGTVLASDAGAAGTGLDLLNLAAAGTYTVMVRDDTNANVGEYALHFFRTPAAQPADVADGDGGGLTSGQTLSASLTAGDLDAYTFTLQAGGGAVVRVSELGATTFGPRIDVFGPTGARLNTQTGAGAAVITLTNVAAGGTYTVVVRDSGDDNVGQYALALDAVTGGDTRAPRVTAARFDYHVRHRLVYTLTEAVAKTLETTDLVLQNLTTGQSVPPELVSATFNPLANQVTFTFPGYPGGLLPDGNYTASLPAASLLDAAGNGLEPFTPLAFYALGGDSNRDRNVDFADLVVLAQNYDKLGGMTFDKGDFNYDGNVDFNDLVILAQNYDKTLPPPIVPPPPGATVPGATTTAAREGRQGSHAVFSTAPIVPVKPKPEPKAVTKPLNR
jgi:hypothetical protein